MVWIFGVLAVVMVSYAVSALGSDEHEGALVFGLMAGLFLVAAIVA